MKPVAPNLLPLLAVAAELRAGGAPWAKVGAKVNRSAETVRQWPRLHAEHWDPLFRKAERRQCAEAATEARVALRQLLRHEDPKIVLAAARALEKTREEQCARDEQAAPAPADAAEQEMLAFARYVYNMSEAEVDELVQQTVERHQAKAAEAAAAPDTVPVPPSEAAGQPAERPTPERTRRTILEFVGYLKELSPDRLAALVDDFLSRGAAPAEGVPEAPREPQVQVDSG